MNVDPRPTKAKVDEVKDEVGRFVRMLKYERAFPLEFLAERRTVQRSPRVCMYGVLDVRCW